MKALFIRVNGMLTPDMLVGGLIDMGVPAVYLRAKLDEADIQETFVEKAYPKAQIPAHFFRIPEEGEKPLLLKQADIFRLWRGICEKGAPHWEETGWKVFSALTSGASDALDEIPATIVDLRRAGVTEENLIALYLFLAGLDYLGVESIFVVPFAMETGNTEAGRTTEKILIDAGAAAGKPISADRIHPFAAAMLEGLAAAFIPMDGRFLVDKTAYGTGSEARPGGDNTVAEYLGYFTDRGETIFSRHLKVFGMLSEER